MTSKTANSDRLAPRKIVIVAYDGAKLLDISGPLQAFNDASFDDGRPSYQVILASEAGGPVLTDAGVRMETLRLDEAVIDSVDTLLIAGGDLIMPPELTASLRARLVECLDRPRRLGANLPYKAGSLGGSRPEGLGQHRASHLGHEPVQG